MTDAQRKICLRAIDHYGINHQEEKAKEELAELLTELSRLQDGRTTKEKIVGELADVLVMCEQLRLIFGASDVDKAVDYKLTRLVRRIKLAGALNRTRRTGQGETVPGDAT